MQWSEASSAAQVCALGAGLIYFSYRVLAGWFNTAASVNLDAKRIPINDAEKDVLIVTLIVEHGEHGALHVLVAEAQISSFDLTSGKLLCSEAIPFVGVCRVGIVPRKNRFPFYRLVSFIDWKIREPRPFRLSPKERTQFECSIQVPKNAICNVELAMLGRKPFSTAIAQWRASVVSAPIYSSPSSINT